MQIREEDTERIDKLNQLNIDSETVNDHYMYLMPDDFIIDAVVNPLGWTEEENFLAKKISKQRNIDPRQI